MAAASDSVVSTSVVGAGTRFMPPEELAMQSLTKQLYKARLFRGFYLERCYVEQLGGYRDVIALQRSERELEKQLLGSACQLQQFYQRFVPNMWIGITKGSVGAYSHLPQHTQLDTCIWSELSDLAFGEYWFSIKSIRFRDQEVQLKLKMVRAVELEPQPSPRRTVSLSERNSGTVTTVAAADSSTASAQTQNNLSTTSIEEQVQIGVADFVVVLQQWGESIKQTIYDFMANDINKRNIMSTIRFLGLLLLLLTSGAVVALRFLSIFVVRFLFEVSRLTHTLTPIAFKLIDFVNKIIGAFFILLTMIWKDLMVRRAAAAKPSTRFKSIAYEPMNRPHHRHSLRYGATNLR